MPLDKQHRHPKTGASPPDRQIKLGGNPASLDAETIAWQFHRMDSTHQHWGWDQLHAPVWRQILGKLKSFEGLTWASIKEAAGGKHHGTNNHSIKISELNAPARRRISELRLEEYDKVFSLRFSNTIRIYGIRDGRAMRLLWYDPYHGGGRGVCPTRN
ncbi:MAG TPA: hypothetical protein VIH76_09755 [Candidatus Acidoferrales bacterium]